MPACWIQLYFYRLILVTRPSPEPPPPGGLAASPNLWCSSKVGLDLAMNVKSDRMTGNNKLEGAWNIFLKCLDQISKDKRFYLLREMLKLTRKHCGWKTVFVFWTLWVGVVRLITNYNPATPELWVSLIQHGFVFVKLSAGKIKQTKPFRFYTKKRI